MVLIYICIFSFGLFFINTVEGEADSVLELEEKLSQISEDERTVLEDLFLIHQEIEAMEREVEQIENQIHGMTQEITDLEIKIEQENQSFEKGKENLKQVLRSYQRMGTGSYIKIILESNSISGFLRRINILRDMTKNTGKLLNSLEESKAKMVFSKENLDEKLSLVEAEKIRLKIALEKNIALKNDLQQYLNTMAEQRDYYSQYLDNIKVVWNELKPMFYNTTKEFNRIISSENLPEDLLKINLTLKGIRGSIEERTFNEILTGRAYLPKIEISFYKDEIKMELPEKYLILQGGFVILNKNQLEFKVNRGSFFGMELEQSAIADLFKEGPMVLDISPLIGKNEIISVEILNRSLELLVLPRL
ncbi:coiled-coil domain-containing protein [Alkaliphilus oremlandii]|uniref:Peptidoglycan hydrolase PcsB coiled-coil domain-containing protein n=1 Tax=Alkaliphilus oremlandii (strain OhILAs) TaxID=350688 RepID=A8MM52_ALKOO|nr:hypothetical protein [Alkaliphilus oremlandii]ABW18219.1 hypothetical protein Clos_0659 [Alkaliphilus oremlandii OhILAs]